MTRPAIGIALDADTLVRADGAGAPVVVPAVLVSGPWGAVVGSRALAMAESGAPAFRDFTRRVGDPVPVLGSDGTGRPAAALTAVAVGALTGPDPRHLTVAHPAWWGRHELVELRFPLLPAVPGRSLSTVPRPVAAVEAPAPGLAGRGGQVLVVDVGDSATEISVLDGVGNGTARVVTTTWTEEFGAAVLDRAVVALALRRSGPLPAAAAPAAVRAFADRCRGVRRALDDVSQAMVGFPLSDRPAVAVTRAEIDEAILEPVEELIAGIHHTGCGFGSVLVVGTAARTPLLLRGLREAFGRPVVVAPDPDTAVARGAARIAARRAAAVPVAVPSRTPSRPTSNRFAGMHSEVP